jgi:hypothetical protein
MSAGANVITGTVAAGDPALEVVVKGEQSSALPVTVGTGAAATSTLTRTAANAASVQLLAANANRRGATFVNNSVQKLYLKLGTTASIGAGTESFTAILQAEGYYEIPYGYTGRVDGIWAAADANGECIADEITA